MILQKKFIDQTIDPGAKLMDENDIWRVKRGTFDKTCPVLGVQIGNLSPAHYTIRVQNISTVGAWRNE
ncbi:hypothetical protein [Thalassobacillus devorans]|uniref:hypothetical protein n=1 Tax=Thalassobacillus devorans TaxID=279813 RepID=UPI000491AFCB|nr:hypothetical protein [Thalassobacillus devorans]